MNWTCRTVDREFTPAEAAKISGVSTALQRDWRRRGILPENSEGKWTRWDLSEVIRLCVMKLFSDAGIDVSKTVLVSQMAILPTLKVIGTIDGATEFDGNELSIEERASILRGMVGTSDPRHTLGRYLAACGEGETDFRRVDKFEDLKSLITRDRPILSIIDCQNLARLIVKRAAGPVIRFEVEIVE